MLEDRAIETSSQRRHWTFTPDELASKRRRSNEVAIQQIKQIQLSRRDGEKEFERAACPPGDPMGVSIGGEPGFLTWEEEAAVVNYYCIKVIEISDHLELPTNVKATAVQYLKRFYLSNSPMLHHPKELVKTVVFLSTKTENHYIPLQSFASKIANTSPEEILESEFLITQGLRFMFDVRHPHRALEGGVMELIGMLDGRIRPTPASDEADMKEAQRKLLSLNPLSSGDPSTNVRNRIFKAHAESKEILKTSALVTDAYFCYLPSQIWLGALILADQPLGEFLLEVKLADPEERQAAQDRVMACARLLRQCPYSRDLKLSAEQNVQLKRLHKTMKTIQQSMATPAPSERDVSRKRNGNAELDPSPSKTKKSKIDGGDPFGPPLVR